MHIQMRGLGRLAGLLLALGGAGAGNPAMAFDRIDRLMPVLAASTGGILYEEVFRYVGFGGEPPPAYYKSGTAAFPSGVVALDKALADPQRANALTGIRLDQVRAVLVYGAPPGEVLAILGPKGFAAGAPEVLAQRGFEKSVVAGVEMLALGADHSVNIRARNVDDPFGHMMGSAQRIVVLDDVVVTARGTMYAALAAAPLARPIACVTCKTIATLVEGIRPAAGQRAHIRAAMAYGARAFLGGVDVATTSGAPADPAELKRRVEAMKAARARLPVFGVALFAHTSGESGHALHIALSFLDQGAAEQAARAIAERIGAKAWGTTSGMVARGAQLPAGVEIKTSLASVGPGFAGVVTITHVGEPADAAAREFSLWHRMISNRDFWPMQILE